MSTSTTQTAKVGGVSKLPRGPHSLTPEEVASSQRGRIVEALTEIAAEVGIDATRVADVCKRAGVSNSAFYAQFSNKSEGFLAAYDEMAAAVTAAVLGEFTDDRSWREFIASAMTAYLGVLEAAPASAKLFLVESASAPGDLRERRRQRHQEFAELIRLLHEHARSQEPGLVPATPGTYLAVVHGITGLVSEHLDTDGPSTSATLHDDLCRFLVALIVGLEDHR